MKWIEIIKVWFSIKIIWKVFPKKIPAAIRLYEATEDDSAWQLLYGMKLVEDHKKRAELFAQAVEETHHGELFRNLHAEMFQEKFHKFTNKKFPLYRGKENAWRLFVYCLIGEADAAERFDQIQKFLPEGPFKNVLKQIVADEIGHIHKAKLLLKADGKNNREINKEIQKITWNRLKEGWMRAGRQVTSFIIDLLLTIIYFVMGLLFSPFTIQKEKKLNTQDKNLQSLTVGESRT